MNKIPIIVFYPVNNEMGYGRHSFDYKSDVNAFAELMELGERLWFVLNTDDYSSRYPNLDELQECYNDEYLDGGSWCWTGFLAPDDLKEIVGY